MNTLLASKASPFVRRVTMLLHSQNIEAEIQYVAIFTEEDRALVYQHSPTGRIPVLLTDAGPIWDSLAISRHLLSSTGLTITSAEEQQLLLVNEANDSAVTLFQLRMFEEDPNWTGQLAKLHLQRIQEVLTHFEQTITTELASEWPLLNQWLYCFLDWLDFREVYDWRKDAPSLQNLLDAHKERTEVKATDPRVLLSDA